MGGKVKEPNTQRKGGRLSNAKKLKIKEEIIKLAEQGRLPSRIEIARQQNINRRTLNTLLDEIKEVIPKDTPELLKVDIIKTYERMKQRIMYWWDKCENAPEKEQSFILEKQVQDQLLKVLKDYRETLLALGVIENVTQNINVKGEIEQKIVQVNIPVEVQQYLQE